jgi:hypothetical protein
MKEEGSLLGYLLPLRWMRCFFLYLLCSLRSNTMNSFQLCDVGFRHFPWAPEPSGIKPSRDYSSNAFYGYQAEQLGFDTIPDPVR